MSLFNFKELRQKIREKKKQKEIQSHIEEKRIFKTEDNQSKFDHGLRNSSKGLSQIIDKVVNQYQAVDDSLFELLEEQLIGYDVGYLATKKIVDAIIEEIKFQKITEIELIKQVILDKLLIYYIQDSNISNDIDLVSGRTNVALVVGVNGVGKTTSIAKIAHYFIQQHKKVLLVAADTFRAGAVEQLVK